MSHEKFKGFARVRVDNARIGMVSSRALYAGPVSPERRQVLQRDIRATRRRSRIPPPPPNWSDGAGRLLI